MNTAPVQTTNNGNRSQCLSDIDLITHQLDISDYYW